MKRIKPSENNVVEVTLTGVASILKPMVYVLDGRFYCLLPVDTAQSVLGEGSTPEQAVGDWDARLKVHLSKAGNDDQVVRHVHEILNPPSPVEELYKKYGIRPVDKSRIGK